MSGHVDIQKDQLDGNLLQVGQGLYRIAESFGKLEKRNPLHIFSEDLESLGFIVDQQAFNDRFELSDQD